MNILDNHSRLNRLKVRNGVSVSKFTGTPNKEKQYKSIVKQFLEKIKDKVNEEYYGQWLGTLNAKPPQRAMKHTLTFIYQKLCFSYHEKDEFLRAVQMTKNELLNLKLNTNVDVS